MGAYLAHPNVVTVLGGVISPKCNGVLMEAAATSLADVVEQYACDERARVKTGKPTDIKVQKSFYYKVACTLLQVANAIKAMHAKCVLHCDIKPSNILITVDPCSNELVAKVADLGSCQLVSDVDAFTRTSVVSGTVHYQAPESMGVPPSVLQKSTGKLEIQPCAHISAHTDVWAFGITMPEVLNLGKNPITQLSKSDEELLLAMPPYNSRSLAHPNSVNAKDKERPLSIRILSDCPRVFVDLAQKCLIIDPKERATMAQVYAGLQEVVKQLHAGLDRDTLPPAYRDFHISLASLSSDAVVTEQCMFDLLGAMENQKPWDFSSMRAALPVTIVQGQEKQLPEGSNDDSDINTGREKASTGPLNGLNVLQEPRRGECVSNAASKRVYTNVEVTFPTSIDSINQSAEVNAFASFAIESTPPKCLSPCNFLTKRYAIGPAPASLETLTGSSYVSSGSANARSLLTGPRGGTYYCTASGNKRYVEPAPASLLPTYTCIRTPSPPRPSSARAYAAPPRQRSKAVFSETLHNSSGSANGRAIHTGARGGNFYYSANGKKVYTKK